MKVVLADGTVIGFKTQYDFVKYVLFGAPRLGVTIVDMPFMKVTPETLPLFKIKRRIEKLRLERDIANFSHDDHIPF